MPEQNGTLQSQLAHLFDALGHCCFFEWDTVAIHPTQSAAQEQENASEIQSLT